MEEYIKIKLNDLINKSSYPKVILQFFKNLDINLIPPDLITHSLYSLHSNDEDYIDRLYVSLQIYFYFKSAYIFKNPKITLRLPHHLVEYIFKSF